METKDSGFSTIHQSRAESGAPLTPPGPDTQTVSPGVSQESTTNRVYTADGRVTGTKG